MEKNKFETRLDDIEANNPAYFLSDSIHNHYTINRVNHSFQIGFFKDSKLPKSLEDEIEQAFVTLFPLQ